MMIQGDEAMSDTLQLLFLLFLYIPATLLVNRLILFARPSRRHLPAQGTIAASACAALVLVALAGGVLLGSSLSEKIVWMGYLLILLGCGALIYVSVMCVSESGRRFYLMSLIEKSSGMTSNELQNIYGKDHMLTVRLERLCAWGVLVKSGDGYQLKKVSAFYYSRIFYLWGILLGFSWFRQVSAGE
jgi:small-conductance mechanosensitive channel